MRFYSLEKLINLHDGYRRVFTIDRYRLLLLQEEGERFLVESHCPHADYSLERGLVGSGAIRCPRHGIGFDLQDGRVVTGNPTACRALQVYPLAYEGNEVGVLI